MGKKEFRFDLNVEVILQRACFRREKITKNHGFSDKEVAGLEIYLEMNCDEIYKKAKEIGKFTNLL